MTFSLNSNKINATFDYLPSAEYSPIRFKFIRNNVSTFDVVFSIDLLTVISVELTLDST